MIMDQPKAPRLRNKILAYLGAWLLALFATSPTGSLWSVAWMFPLGLCAFFFPPVFHEGGWGAITIGTAIYLLHAIFYFRARTPRGFWTWFAVLMVILLCNVAGCRGTLITH
jgi:hypothetical protein